MLDSTGALAAGGGAETLRPLRRGRAQRRETDLGGRGTRSPAREAAGRSSTRRTGTTTLPYVTKRWLGFAAYDARSERVILGPRRVRRYFIAALRELKDWSARKMAGAPTILGEFGLPFDLNGARAYRTGDYRVHERALSAYYDAVDASLLDSTIWNYTAANRHDRGDLWNTEDLSKYSAATTSRPGGPDRRTRRRGRPSPARLRTALRARDGGRAPRDALRRAPRDFPPALSPRPFDRRADRRLRARAAIPASGFALEARAARRGSSPGDRAAGPAGAVEARLSLEAK